jgi:hypothetical protein
MMKNYSTTTSTMITQKKIMMMKMRMKTKLVSKTKYKSRNLKKKKYRPKMKTMTTNQGVMKIVRWKPMTTTVKKKTIKENVEPEESEYCLQVGNTSKQERKKQNITVQILRRCGKSFW